MLVSIVIVNFNTIEDLGRCIESLYSIEDPLIFEIIVIDNGSILNPSEQLGKIKRNHNNFSFQILEKKVGFSAANNIGINSSRGDFILIMNPDVIFTEKLLNELTQKLNEDGKIGAICPLLIGSDGKFQNQYFLKYPGIIQFWVFSSVLAKLLMKIPFLMKTYVESSEIETNTGKLNNVQHIPCAFFLTKKNILNEIGNMDEDYPLFFEDVDLSFRIAAKHSIVVDSSLRITHSGGASFKSEDDLNMYANYVMGMNLFFDKHYGIIRRFTLKVVSFSNSVLVLFLELLKKTVGKSDLYRYKKHRNFIRMFKSRYL